eukprot:1852335-Amphidinium_carterae.1
MEVGPHSLCCWVCLSVLCCFLRPNGTMLFHLAYTVSCNANGTVTLVDFKPSIGVDGCGEAAAEDPSTDAAYAFTLPGLASGQCVGADSPDGDPSGESWMVRYTPDACDGAIVV